MTKPFGYYASAPSGTTDAAILSEIEQLYGSQLEKLTCTQKAAWLIVLMAETIPTEVSVNYGINDVPNLKYFNLNDGAKLSLCNAIINQLLYEGQG